LDYGLIEQLTLRFSYANYPLVMALRIIQHAPRLGAH